MTPAGTLSFTPASNTIGSASLSLVLHDNGGTNNGGINTSAPQTFNIFVLPAKAPPDANLSCAGLIPAPASNYFQFIAQGGIVTNILCGQPTTVTFVNDNSNGGSGCAANPLAIRRTYRITTGCGDSLDIVQTFTIIDTTTPLFVSFPADATFTCSSQVPPADNSYVTASDNCSGSVTVSHDGDVITAGSCANHYTVTRTYHITDSCGNSTSRIQHITVDDESAPVITGFPSDATFTCAGSVPSANDSLVSAIDNCGGSSPVITHVADIVTSSNCVNRFTITRTYRATDACGNATSRSQTITVLGTTLPTIAAFPADVTYSCASLVPSADDSIVSATNGCGGNSGVVITHTADVISSSNCVSRFTISRTYIASDACGNSSTKTQLITIDNTTAPQITGFPGNTNYSCAGQVPPPNDSQITAIDNCGALPAVTHDSDLITESNCPNHFTVTRTYRVTDACGNSTSRSQTITVNDKTAPVLRAPLPSLELNFSCASEVLPADDSIIHAVDNCGGGVTVTHESDSLVSSNCVNRFTLSRVYHVTDSCGNTTNFTQTIHVNSTTAPTITVFPADVTYTCASAVPTADDSVVTATDGCGTGQVHVSHGADAISSATCDNRYVIRRTYTAVDACGNSSSKTQTITINNTTPPTITQFPTNASYSCASDVPQANDSLVTATNACGDKFGMLITHGVDVITSSNCVNRFTIARTYTATDNCGNATTRTQTITVNATTAPTITTFPADATYSCASAVLAADNSLISATDGCGGNSGIIFTHNADAIASSNCLNHFTITRTYIATDACGNSSSKSQLITVNATNAPTIAIFPSDATYQCSSQVPAPDDNKVGATDSCGGSAPTVISHLPDVLSSSNCVSRFAIARTYIATDACGNSASRTQTITVDSTTPPQITVFPPNANFSCAGSVPPANDSLVTAIDNCGALPNVTHDADSITESNCPNHFTITRTYRVSDACGNSTSRSQTITVDDKTAPSLRAPLPNFELNVSCAGDVPTPDDSIIHAADNCGGGVTVTHDADTLVSSNCVNRFTLRRIYHVADSCGNTTNFTQTIHVNSTTAPTITVFPVDATYTCSSAVPTADDTLVTAIDGCGTGQVHISHSADAISSATCDNRYVIHRTYTAVDACGNSSSKTQTITINNTTAPTITQFPADATYSCAGDVPQANNSLVTATNACGDKFGMIITHGADVITSSNCVSRFTISRTYTATDNCGNSTSRIQTITVNATTAPTITTFPANASYSCASAVPAADDTSVSATDGCGAHSVIIAHGTDIITSSNCVNRFTIARTYTATDACGNSASKTQTITVNATTAPTIKTFPIDATYSCASAVPSADNTTVSATDGCGANALVITHATDVITSSNCVNRFIISRAYTATDACGNSASKTQTITVNGTTPPTITAFPVDATFACSGSVPGANDSLVTATDNCGAASVTVTHDSDVIVSNICVNRFIIQRTYHVTDACGNATSKTQTITVNDTIAPEISCPPGFTVSLFDDVPGPNIELVTATDNCGVPSKSYLGDSVRDEQQHRHHYPHFCSHRRLRQHFELFANHHRESVSRNGHRKS